MGRGGHGRPVARPAAGGAARGRRVTRGCIFCRIIAKQEPGDILYEDDEVIVFRNVLRWVPVMLLAVPKEHLTQGQLWTTMMGKVGPIAARIGAQYCPSGFRLL